ncbi:MAG: type I-E CRISPR-associated protein Cse2/CasB, partial [Pseudomonadota bacterium]
IPLAKTIIHRARQCVSPTYVEPFIKSVPNSWRRDMHYLAAGLWAAHWRDDHSSASMSIGKACAVFDSARRKNMGQDDRTKTSSTEKRFVTLLDADSDQLPHRLRQMLALLKDQAIDFESLLQGLLKWNDEQKHTQNDWARDYYRNLYHETNVEQQNNMEISE